jgi:hypothetical protein
VALITPPRSSEASDMASPQIEHEPARTNRVFWIIVILLVAIFLGIMGLILKPSGSRNNTNGGIGTSAAPAASVPVTEFEVPPPPPSNLSTLLGIDSTTPCPVATPAGALTQQQLGQQLVELRTTGWEGNGGKTYLDCFTELWGSGSEAAAAAETDAESLYLFESVEFTLDGANRTALSGQAFYGTIVSVTPSGETAQFHVELIARQENDGTWRLTSWDATPQ